ncbi:MULTISPECIES: hypothetical protein [Flavobacterium]|jgi:hypothetical protein|uniref:Phosphoribosylpyrophosphate synthetase n=1 Tax=Flavobacterium lindanitolerans TaxID=428988 RepID=A0A497TZP8_9FLAO|nr:MULTISPECIES: hypothetical protein [Flavobacterium]MBU7571420.1 hypothetical protein [Flavobacterium sp.]PZO32779.1 MAG: hypothetical protein DCE86_06805 [Flavobacteriaceae bacterium]PZQ84364.1 MAG: hypothetical protein DI548_09780 [Flavobacterium johnsoniae]KQS52553.1 hypothetical protein ASG38_02685 [Flavobacterium sp. Leaf359]MBL7867430.1 hypothetical protein [Flavobacterium lindanitolerans]
MDHQMYHYATVSKALEELAEKGFTVDFNLEADRIKDCGDCFEIVHIYRYEGATDPGDEATVYGIKSDKGEKGVYVSGDLSFSEDEAAQTLHELVIKGRQPSE